MAEVEGISGWRKPPPTPEDGTLAELTAETATNPGGAGTLAELTAETATNPGGFTAGSKLIPPPVAS
jgi:hypothetical protein